MDRAKQRKLEAAGWTVAGAQTFLGLSDEEAAVIEIKVALAHLLKTCREEHHLTQVDVARRLGSSQSRVAKMEAADSSVSMDLLIRSYLNLGGSRRDLATAVAGK